MMAVTATLYRSGGCRYIQLTEFTGGRGIDRFDETHFDNDDDAALKAVSDHRPVWADFDTHIDDD